MSEQLDANVTKFFNQMVKDAGLKNEDLLCASKTVVVTIAGNKAFKATIIPEGLDIVNSGEQVDDAIKRVITDDAYTVSLVDGLGRFTDAKINGKSFDKQSVQKFYDNFTTLSLDQKRETIFAVFDNLNKILEQEVNRVDPSFPDDTHREIYAELIAGMSEEPIPAIFDAYTDALKFVMFLAQEIIRGESTGRSLEESRDHNREVGAVVQMMYEVQIFNPIMNQVVKQNFLHLLPKGSFEKLEAFVERLDSPKLH